MKINYRDDLTVDMDLAVTGERGRDGRDGRDGIDGRDGADGAAGESPRGWTFRGEWSSSQKYSEGDVVTNEGSSYLCLQDNNKDREPPGRQWAVVAAAGRDGEDGRDGFGSKGVKGDKGESTAIDVPATADAPMAIGDVIYVSGGGRVDLAVAAPAALVGSLKARAFGMVTSVKGAAVKYRTAGVVENPDWSLTPMAVYYLSPTVPGGITTTYPDESGQFVVIVGVATSPTQIALNIHWMLEQS